MNKDEILEMNPGNELDALVAEKLFHWRCYQEKRGEWSLCVAVKENEREPWMASQKPDPERYKPISCMEAVKIGFFGRALPKYSTDIAEAWEVVEKFTPNVLINYLPPLVYTEGWHCNINGFHVRGCDTAPEAICKCALLAMEEATRNTD